MVTKGFCPLAQDAVYRLSDMEEDEEDEEHGGIGVLEKGASERGKEDEDEEEEEGGITFKVRVSSTPEERKDRKHSVAPLPVPILSPTLPMLPGTPATTSSVTSVLCLTPTPHHATDKSSLSSQSIPGVCTTVVQSQTSICTSISTTASSSGKILCFNEQYEFLPSQLKILTTWFVCVQSNIQESVTAPPSPPTPSQPVASCTPLTSHRSPKGKSSGNEEKGIM